MPHALPLTPGYHTYIIKLEPGYGSETEEIELDAVGPEVALRHLSAIPNKRHAIMFEDGEKIADLTFLEGFWQVSG